MRPKGHSKAPHDQIVNLQLPQQGVNVPASSAIQKQSDIWYAVKRSARLASIDSLAPHDLRRSCARLCHGCGGELEQIQFLLGHASVQTTERYIGCKQSLKEAVNDRFGILVASHAA
jgi:site-specific recombinase XerD